VAVDNNGDPLHSELHTAANQEVYDGFLLYLRVSLRYQLATLTMEFDPRLDWATKRVFGLDIPHQKCLWHATEIVKAFMVYPQALRRLKNLTRQIKELEEGLADQKQSSYDTKKMLNTLRAQRIQEEAIYQDKEALLEHFRELVFAHTRETSEELRKGFRQLYGKRYTHVV
jgi:hypothetical protein